MNDIEKQGHRFTKI